MKSCIDFERLEREADFLRSAYRSAAPFPHIVVDDFLRPEALQVVMDALPPPVRTQKSSDYIFAKEKFENPTFWSVAPIFGLLRAELLSDRFAAVLSAMVDRQLFVDPKFVGGGLHQGGKGSFLDMHADFSRHPAEPTWLRELNLLLYLNAGWEPEYGGQLELRHSETGAVGSIEPKLNRMVFMLTKGHTLHGYKPINFPEGSYRTSIAAYAYSKDTDFASNPARTTVWKPEGASVAKSLAASVSPTLVRVKNALLGSSTTRRANGENDPSGQS